MPDAAGALTRVTLPPKKRSSVLAMRSAPLWTCCLLHGDVWGVADFTTGDPPQIRPRRSSQQVQSGADRIARTLLRFFGGNVTLVGAPAASGVAFLAYLQRRPYATITASVEGGLLTNLHVIINQDTLLAANSHTSRARE